MHHFTSSVARIAVVENCVQNAVALDPCSKYHLHLQTLNLALNRWWKCGYSLYARVQLHTFILRCAKISIIFGWHSQTVPTLFSVDVCHFIASASFVCAPVEWLAVSGGTLYSLALKRTEHFHERKYEMYTILELIYTFLVCVSEQCYHHAMHWKWGINRPYFQYMLCYYIFAPYSWIRTNQCIHQCVNSDRAIQMEIPASVFRLFRPNSVQYLYAEFMK